MTSSKLLGSCLAVVLGLVVVVPATGCAAPADEPPGQEAVVDGPIGKDAAKLDDFKNCKQTSLTDQDCAALHSGTVLGPGLDYLFNFGTFDRRQRVQFTNTGTVAVRVYAEQGLGWGPRTRVEIGQTVDVGPIDNQWWSYGLWSLLVESVDESHALDANTGKAHLSLGDPSPARKACDDSCNTRFSGCMQGCQEAGGGAGCMSSCNIAASNCLDACARNNP